MRQRDLLALVFLGLALGGGLVLTVTVYLLAPGPDSAPVGGVLAGAVAAVTLLCLSAWFVVERLVARPARRLARGIRALLESRSPDQTLPIPQRHVLGDLPAAIEALADALRGSRREIRKSMQSATAQVEEQKNWLEVILQSLNEGVVVCNRQNQILLYNNAAATILGQPDRIGLGRSLFQVVSPPAVQHTLERLERRHREGPGAHGERTAPFVCASIDGRRMLHGRMGLLLDPQGAMSGYLITLVDISSDVALLGKGDAVHRALTRDLRGVIGNLRAAAETVAAHPGMSADDRRSFDDVILSESETLSRRLEELGQEIRGQTMGRWPMADIYVADLVNCINRRLQDLPGVQITMIGMPLWVHGDSLSLMLVLEALVRRIHEHTGVTAFDMEARLGDRRVYVDILWQGAPIPSSELEGWLSASCGEEGGGQRLRDIVERHDCEPWSQPAGASGQALVRLPLLAPNRPQFLPDEERLPPRPEFYDFGLMREHQGGDALAATPLRDLTFVVFDCEMTGLDPMGGDEVISIAGVRVVKRRVLTGETFNRLINPERPIPADSVRFHGITDDDVRDKPPIQVVLPQFRSFAGEAVLVAHNAAFDMKFLTMKQAECGVEFDNPVLDSLLLSSMLDGEEEDLSLDALCDRYGIRISGRHTALGDALGTAELLVRLIDRLEAQGYETFGEVMERSNMAAQLRQRSAIVSHSSGQLG